MANHAQDELAYWVAVPNNYTSALYPLRAWPRLEMATTDERVWLRGFSREELDAVDVLRIPMVERYYLRGGRLYPLGKFLPARVAPNLTWADLRQRLPIELPKENFNYFGIKEECHISLIPSARERPSAALVTDLNVLEAYLFAAPRVRLIRLQWTILSDGRAVVLGTPLLPIQGRTYYLESGFLIPAGWKLRYEGMAATYRDAFGDSDMYWYFFDDDGQLSKLRKDAFNALSKGSFANIYRLP